MRQFSIYWINLDPTIGSEIKKTRPGVVVSPNEMNENLNTVIIAPLTSTLKNYPTRVAISVHQKNGEIALDQIRCVDRSRLNKKMGTLDPTAIDKTKEILIAMFR